MPSDGDCVTYTYVKDCLPLPWIFSRSSSSSLMKTDHHQVVPPSSTIHSSSVKASSSQILVFISCILTNKKMSQMFQFVILIVFDTIVRTSGNATPWQGFSCRDGFCACRDPGQLLWPRFHELYLCTRLASPFCHSRVSVRNAHAKAEFFFVVWPLWILMMKLIKSPREERKLFCLDCNVKYLFTVCSGEKYCCEKRVIMF